MGNGSPRLRSRFVRRTVLVGLAALYFAPSAFADGAIVAASVNGGPVAASVAVGVPTAPVAAEPPAAPVTPVASPLPATNPPVQATVDTRKVLGPIAVATTRALPVVADPAPAQPQRPRPRKLLPNKQPTSQRAAALSSVDSSRIGASARGPFPEVRAGSPVREQAPRLPQIPVPGPSGLGLGGSDGTVAPGFGFVLLALAAALAIFRAPPLGRRVSLLLAAPRPHAHLLQLERPD
jgi:hypothetical protein